MQQTIMSLYQSLMVEAETVSGMLEIHSIPTQAII
jgi:hypothetical protein